MKKEYREITISWGSTLEDAVKELLKYKEKEIRVHLEFNGVDLYSDTVSMEQAYRDVVGISKSEFNERQKKHREEWKRSEEEYIEKIPELVKIWTDRGRALLDESRWSSWEENVKILLSNGLYKGLELRQCLEVVEALNRGDTFEKVKVIVDEQRHSGMSYSLIRFMVSDFCDRGMDFFDSLEKS